MPLHTLAGEVKVGMGGAPGGALGDVGTLRGCVAVRGRSAEEEGVGMGGGLGGVLFGRGTPRGLLACCRGSGRVWRIVWADVVG